MSNELLNTISRDIILHSNGEITLFDCQIQRYSSDKLEYYFAVSKHEF